MKEIVFDGVTGRLLPPGDRESWVKAILTMNTDEAARLGRQGREWMRNHVSPQAWNQQFSAIAQQVLSR